MAGKKSFIEKVTAFAYNINKIQVASNKKTIYKKNETRKYLQK
jgi:hypothetical protein